MQHESDSKKQGIISGWIHHQEDRVQRHHYPSSAVSKIKWLIVVLALGLLTGLIIWPLVTSEDKRFNFAFTEMESTPSESPRMVNPHFQGVDESNRPYNVTAASATQESDNIVVLQDVKGDIALEDEAWVSVSSSQGTIRLQEKDLDLEGSVYMISNGGYEFSTTRAHVELKKGMAYGKTPVIAQGPPGDLEAEGFLIKENGDKILFYGPVKLTIYPEATT